MTLADEAHRMRMQRASAPRFLFLWIAEQLGAGVSWSSCILVLLLEQADENALPCAKGQAAADVLAPGQWFRVTPCRVLDDGTLGAVDDVKPRLLTSAPMEGRVGKGRRARVR